MNDAIEQFRDAIRAAGLTPPDDIQADGKLHRFSSNGKRKDDGGYYVLHLDGIPAGMFGDWRTNLSEKWRANIGRTLTEDERRAQRQRIDEMRAQRDAEDARRKAEAAKTAAALWKAATPAGEDHPYLVRKGVSPVETLREIQVEDLARVIGYRPKKKDEPLIGRVLVAPVKVGGKLSTVEMIDENGRKSALAGGAKAGGYWSAQALPEGDGTDVVVLVGEGVSTALSAREATGHLAVAALSVGALEAAARAIRGRYPRASIVILADLLKDSGKPDEYATQAARAVGGAVAVPDFGDEREAGDTDFNDMAQRVGLTAVRCVIEAALASPGEAAEQWPDPKPLTSKVEEIPYPLDALPDELRAAVEEVAQFSKAPVPLVASCALAALSTAAQAYADVKRAERLKGPIGLFFLSLGESGERKTTLDGYFTESIVRYEKQKADEMKPIVEQYRADLDAWAAERDGIMRAITDAGKKGDSTAELKDRLAALTANKPAPPRIPRLIFGDATPEALAYSLAKGWPSGAVVSSEAGSVFGAHGMGKDSVMRNLATLNQLWDGRMSPIERRTSESFTVRNARLTVGLMVQEATLHEFFSRSGKLARGSGFLARFLVAWPRSTQGTRTFTDPPAVWPALTAFHRRITAILSSDPEIDDDGALIVPVLEFDDEARRGWIAFHDLVEVQLGSGGDFQDVRDVAAKTADNAARLAALFHVYVVGPVGKIAAGLFDGAARIAAWHLYESRRFFGELAVPAEMVNAGKLDAWLLEHCRRTGANRVPSKVVLQFGPNALRSKPVLDAALDELAELDRIRITRDGRSKLIEVNPALLAEVA